MAKKRGSSFLAPTWHSGMSLRSQKRLTRCPSAVPAGQKESKEISSNAAEMKEFKRRANPLKLHAEVRLGGSYDDTFRW